MSAPVIIEGVSHYFGTGELRKQVLKDISCEVEAGEIVILTGPSGSGKTTFSQAIEERIGGLFTATEQYHSLAGFLPKLKGLKKIFYGVRGKPVPDSPLKGVAQPGVVAKPSPAIRTSTYIVYYGIEYILYRLIVRRKLRRFRSTLLCA